MSKTISITEWGKDHWSLLGYFQTLVMDARGSTNGRSVGQIQYRHLRVNRTTHPMVAHQRDWDPAHCTRLKTSSALPEHDDIDCWDDMNAAGLIEMMSLPNGFVSFTKKGVLVIVALMEHKIGGGSFSEFGTDSPLWKKEWEVTG